MEEARVGTGPSNYNYLTSSLPTCTPDAGLFGCLALEVVDGVTVGVDDTERGASSVVFIRIPEHVYLVKRRASNLRPVALGILNGSNRVAVVGARHRPASLGDPDPDTGVDSVYSIASSLDGLPEGGGTIVDGCALEVGVTVHADEVAGLDHGVVVAVDPGETSVCS